MSSDGQLDTGQLAIEVSGISGAATVSVGNAFACALLADGTIRCWGDPFGGQLGTGTTTSGAATRPAVFGITSAAALSVGYSHACAVLMDGTIQCWGANDSGQLGVGTTAESDIPTTVLGITAAAGVSAGESETCAVLTDGTVQCWGVNSYGQLGDGTRTDSSVPVSVSGLSSAVVVCTGSNHSCASLKDGSVRCWGANAFGENGDGTQNASSVPVVVAGIGNATAVTCGETHTCAVLNDGSIQCWGGSGGSSGGGAIGALGTAVTLDCTWDPSLSSPSPGDQSQTTTYETPCAPTPVQVSGISDAATVAAGYYGACAVLADGSVKCWGENMSGELGNGSVANSIVPVTVMAQAGQQR